jgi:hypothetical protein
VSTTSPSAGAAGASDDAAAADAGAEDASAAAELAVGSDDVPELQPEITSAATAAELPNTSAFLDNFLT